MSVRDRAPASSPIFVPIVLHKKAVFVSVIKPGFHIFLWYCQCSVQINDTVKVLFSTLISSRLYVNSWYKQMNAQEHILDPETSKVYPDVPTLTVNADIAREPSTPMEHLQYQFHLWTARPHAESLTYWGIHCVSSTSVFPPQVLITEINYSDLMFHSEKRKSGYSQFGKKIGYLCPKVVIKFDSWWVIAEILVLYLKKILSSYFLIYNIQIEEFWHQT